MPNDYAAGRSAAQVLLEAGHRRSIYLVGETPDHVIGATERMAGISQALGDADTRLADQINTIWWPEDSYASVSAFIAAGGRASAFICLNDRVALGAYQAIGDAGWRIPQDVSVVSFDDSELAAWLRPTLTSIALPHFQLGSRAVELLLSGEDAGSIERVDMPLHSRGSVGPPRSA